MTNSSTIPNYFFDASALVKLVLQEPGSRKASQLKHDARMDLLEPSDTVTSCPYKGDANHYSVKIGDKLHKDLAWFYQYPTLTCSKIQGLLGFLNEKVDIYEDDRLLPRPETPWS